MVTDDMQRACPVDCRLCDHALCMNACAKQTLPSRCMLRGCIRDASAEAGGRTPRIVYYPATEWGDAKGAPLDLSNVKVCRECSQMVSLTRLENEDLRTLARNLLAADGRSEPDYTRTQLYWLPIGVLKPPEHDGMLEPAKEKGRIIRYD